MVYKVKKNYLIQTSNSDLKKVVADSWTVVVTIRMNGSKQFGY